MLYFRNMQLLTNFINVFLTVKDGDPAWMVAIQERVMDAILTKMAEGERKLVDFYESEGGGFLQYLKMMKQYGMLNEK